MPLIARPQGLTIVEATLNRTLLGQTPFLSGESPHKHGYVLGRTGAERAMLIGSVMLTLVVEVLNAAIEAVVWSSWHHPRPLRQGPEALWCSMAEALGLRSMRALPSGAHTVRHHSVSGARLTKKVLASWRPGIQFRSMSSNREALMCRAEVLSTCGARRAAHRRWVATSDTAASGGEAGAR